MPHVRHFQNRHTQWWYNPASSATRAFLRETEHHMKNYILACALAVSFAAAACVGFDHSTTVTTPTTSSTTNALAGTWQSVQDASGTIIPNPNTCTDFKWV